MTESDYLGDRASVEDNLLQAIAKIAEEDEVMAPITLFIKGSIISGYLIGYTAFFELFEQELKGMEEYSLGAQDAIKRTIDSIRRQNEIWMKELEELKEERGMEYELIASKTSYIYLKDAKIITPANRCIPAGLGGLVRIRTESIDAFSLGMFSDAKMMASSK